MDKANAAGGVWASPKWAVAAYSKGSSKELQRFFKGNIERKSKTGFFSFLDLGFLSFWFEGLGRLASGRFENTQKHKHKGLRRGYLALGPVAVLSNSLFCRPLGYVVIVIARRGSATADSRYNI
jgi:hypothetical protein